MLKIPYFLPWINKNDEKEVIKSMRQRWLTNGPYLEQFEKNFSSFIGTKFSSGVNSATSALHLCLRALGINQNDEVILPTFTFVATANVADFCGAKPVFCDINRETFNIKPEEIKKKITKKTKAIIIVHYGGQACDLKEILEISKSHNIPIIEDCAHSLGSEYKNKKCGNFGIASCFSFYPTKVITTGEGGMISTNNSKLSHKVNLLRSHALNKLPPEREKQGAWKYDVVDLGYNYRLDEIHAALGSSQLNRISTINKKRLSIAKQYNQKLKNLKGIKIPKVKEDRNHIYHLYTIKIENDFHLTRDLLFQKLFKKGIGTSVQYIPLHDMKYYKKKYKKIGSFPNADYIKDKILCLPIYPNMSLNQVNYVIEQIKNS